MKRLLLLAASLLLVSISFSQFCPFLGPDQFLPCGVNTTTLTADLSQCGPGGANPNQTTNYGVTNIPYVAQTNTGQQLFMTDDSQQGPFNIGFTFCFFGQTYTQFYVGSNGWISFSGGQPTTFTSAAIPSVAFNIPKNCIMGPWQDWHPGVGGQIRYQVQGTAPCRKLIVSWINMPMFGCTQTLGTFHIVIYESTNIIENHIQSKQFCNWANGTAVQGIHNLVGSIGITVPGRNSTQWVANNDAHRWTPSGPAVTPTLTWFQVGNPNPIGTGNTITVTPPPGGAQYTCQFVYPTCNAGWNTCNTGQGSNLGPDTVLVVPGPPNLPPPTVTQFNPTCAGSCDGAINVVPNGGNGAQTISWNGPPNNFTISNLCSGTYNFTITDASGCTVSGSVTLTNPPIPVVGPISFIDTVCYNSSNENYTVPQQPGFSYQWTSIGNIFFGQGTNSVNIDWSSISAGFIPGAVTVIGYDANNCPSIPVSIDITVFNVLPVISPVGPFCSYDEFVTLQGTPFGGSFSGTGVADPDFFPANAIGTNTITYTYSQSNCSFDTTTQIVVYPQPTLDSIAPYNPFYEICEGDSVVTIFGAQSNLPGYNEWTFANTIYQQDNITIPFSTIGMFTLSVVHYSNGCVSPQQQTVITVQECPQSLIFIPNSFTPDGNEYNNMWQPTFTSGFDPYSFNLTVYNRWGQVIFESYNHSEGWDGTFNGTMCQEGVYSYVIYYGNLQDDGFNVIRGHVTLIR